MSEESSAHGRSVETLARIPQRLLRMLIVATVMYFIGFIWTFTQGHFGRLFIPYQWESFYLFRAAAEAFQGRWFFYGTTISALFINWLILLGVIAGGYFAFVWIAQKSK
jgi:hypothetical protein